MNDLTLKKLTVDKVVYPGRSLGRADDGIAVFTDGALAGEEVEIFVTKSKKSFREAELISVVKPSPLRIAPRCPSFGRCGGCTFQHTGYDNQRTIKEACIRELMAPYASAIEPLVPSPQEWGYRNKMEFSFFESAAGLSIGLHVKGQFNRYFPVPPCHICDPDFIPVVEAVLAFGRTSGMPWYDKNAHTGFFRHLVLRKSVRAGEVLVNLVTNRADVTSAFFAPLVAAMPKNVASFFWTINAGISDAVNVDELILLAGRQTIQERLTVKGREFSFDISPFSFFQTNTLGTEHLYEAAIDMLGASSEDTVLDLYCGTGTIGILIAPHVRSVIGVEQVAAAIENAQHNSKQNNISNISFAVGSVEKWIKSGEAPEFTALVVDPPRGGLSNKVIDLIAMRRPEKLVYVSCNPATLARDLTEIVNRARYRVRRIVPVDMFPQTYHIETVVGLDRLP